MLNNLLKTILSKDGFLHWGVQRFSAIFTLVLFLTIFLSDSFFLLGVVFIILSYHIVTGISTLLDDYVHGSVEHLTGTTLLRISILFALKALFIIFI